MYSILSEDLSETSNEGNAQHINGRNKICNTFELQIRFYDAMYDTRSQKTKSPFTKSTDRRPGPARPRPLIYITASTFTTYSLGRASKVNENGIVIVAKREHMKTTGECRITYNKLSTGGDGDGEGDE